MPIVTATQITPLAMLQDEDLAHYEALRAETPEFDSPYFSSQFIAAAKHIVPHGYLAKFMTSTGCVGYFAFQRRGKVLQPLASPVNDYHGAVMERGYYPDWVGLLEAAKAKRFEFFGLMGPGAAGCGFEARTRKISKILNGFDAWEAEKKTVAKKYFRNIGRCKRNLDANFSGLKYEFTEVDDKVLDWVMNQKVRQYAQTGCHDVFGCGWTSQMVSALRHEARPDYGLRVGLLRHQDTILAAELCLIDKHTLHFWFPAYDPQFARYSPGTVLTYEIIRHESAAGFQIFDYGSGDEAYKSDMTTADSVCFDGHINRPLELPQPLRPAAAHVRSFLRRLRVIRACEVTREGQFQAALSLGRRAHDRMCTITHDLLARFKANRAAVAAQPQATQVVAANTSSDAAI